MLGALLSELDGSVLGGVIRRPPLGENPVYYKEKLQMWVTVKRVWSFG